jgi:hypothetical protein
VLSALKKSLAKAFTATRLPPRTKRLNAIEQHVLSLGDQMGQEPFG